jgi:dTDP-4-dehydrorhamnose 3,5-epimerase
VCLVLLDNRTVSSVSFAFAPPSTLLQGLVLLPLKRFSDERGYFQELHQQDRYTELGIAQPLVQTNLSLSKKNVIRGMHFQLAPKPQGKLVSVLRGSILDVAIDIRQDSPTFGQHQAFSLSEENALQLWVPAGFAHGFCALEEETLVCYQVTHAYDPSLEKSLNWNDPDLNLPWPISATEAIVSERDCNTPRLRDLPAYFTMASLSRVSERGL